MANAPDVFAQELDHYCLGRALWSPEPLHGDIYIGDVGYIDEDGAFHRLFNVTVDQDHPVNGGGVPSNFEPLLLNQRLLTVRPNYFPAQSFVSRSVKSHSVGGSANVQSGTGAGAGLGYKFECSSSQGGMLIIHDQATKTIVQRSAKITHYIARNHGSWCDFATDPDKYGVQCQPEDIIMVRGTLKTSAWTVAAYRGNMKQTHSFSFNCQLGSVVEATVEATSSEERHMPNVQYRTGPRRQPSSVSSSSEASAVSSRKAYKYELPELKTVSTTYWERRPEEANDQSVFLSYYKIKRRPILPKRIIANAGPSQLPPHDDPAPSKVAGSTGRSDESSAELRLAVDLLLDYILEHSDAEFAIASDGDISDLFEGRTIPEDLYGWLTEIRPRIDVDAENIGTLSDPTIHTSTYNRFQQSSTTHGSISEQSSHEIYEHDNALQVAAFFKSQFHALWQQANSHIGSRYAQGKHDLTYRYCIALAEYRDGTPNVSPERVNFHVQLGPPDLEICCQHEVTLHLNIVKGMFSPDHYNAPSSSHSRSMSAIEEISDTRVTFSVPFYMTSAAPVVVGSVQDFGDEHLIIQLHLDLENAKLIGVSPRVERRREALEVYLQDYLHFLGRAGHDTLFYPPLSPDESLPAPIDFSRSSLGLPGVTHVQNVPVEEINRFLSIAWLIASTTSSTADGAVLPLAECRGSWSSGNEEVHFRLVFGPPQIAALCDREVVICFDLKEALLYKTEDLESSPFRVFSDWRIAILMNVERSEEDSFVVEYHLDRLSSYFMPQFSQLGNFSKLNEDAVGYGDRVIDFISGEYLYILESTSGLVVYHRDSRSPGASLQTPDFDTSHVRLRQTAIAGQGSSSADAVTWTELSQNVDMHGFDMVIALPQTAINDHFRSQWQQAQARAAGDRLLAEWRYQDLFSSAFGPLTIRLLDGGKALLLVNIIEGGLKTVRSGARPAGDLDSFKFADWMIAFDLNLELCDHTAILGVSPGWRESFIRSRFSSYASGDLMHLYLDLQHVDFNLMHSRFKGLNDPRLIDKAQATVVCLRDYLKQLASRGRHVLKTIPVCRPSSDTHSSNVTSVTFRVSSEQRPSVEQSPAFEPAVLILCMNGNRPLPSPLPQHWGRWITNEFSPSRGTLALSADSFLRGRLLPLLSEVNAITRIEPIFSEFHKTTWKLHLTTWAKNPEHELGDCSFVPCPHAEADGVLRYRWKFGRKFSTDCDDAHTLCCLTENYLEFFTASGGSLDMVLRGSIFLELATNNWSSKAHARWKTTLRISFEGGGLRFMMAASPITFTHAESAGRPYSSTPLNPQTLLRNVLPGSVELQNAAECIGELEAASVASSLDQDACVLGNPTFNAKGDLLFQIHTQLHVPPSAIRVQAPSLASTIHGSHVDAPPKRAVGEEHRTPVHQTEPRQQRMKRGDISQRYHGDEDDASEKSPFSALLSPTPVSGMVFDSLHTPATSLASSNPKSAGPTMPFSNLLAPSIITSSSRSVAPKATNDVLSPARPAYESLSNKIAASQSVSTVTTSSTSKNAGTSARRRLSPSPPPLVIPTQPLWRKAASRRDSTTTSSTGKRE